MSLITTLLSSAAAALTSPATLTLLLVLLTLVYWWLTRYTGVLEAKYGLKSEKPTLFFGNAKNMLLGKESMMDFHKRFYEKFKGER